MSGALAADMPAKAPHVIQQSWNGFYIGANIGYAWGNRGVNSSPNDPASAVLFLPGFGGTPPSQSFTSSGALGGVQLGYNWQFNRNWLVGLETDFDWSGMRGSGSSSGIVGGIDPFTAKVDEQIKWFGTVRARLGYLPTDNLLTYVTGGFAYGRVEHSGSFFNSGAAYTLVPGGAFSVVCAANATCFSGSSSSVNVGWTAGAGFEYAIWRNITIKAEYLYVSLGIKSLTETALATNTPGDTPGSFNANYNRTSFNVARVGVNIRF